MFFSWLRLRNLRITTSQIVVTAPTTTKTHTKAVKPITTAIQPHPPATYTRIRNGRKNSHAIGLKNEELKIFEAKSARAEAGNVYSHSKLHSTCPRSLLFVPSDPKTMAGSQRSENRHRTR